MVIWICIMAQAEFVGTKELYGQKCALYRRESYSWVRVTLVHCINLDKEYVHNGSHYRGCSDSGTQEMSQLVLSPLKNQVTPFNEIITCYCNLAQESSRSRSTHHFRKKRDNFKKATTTNIHNALSLIKYNCHSRKSQIQLIKLSSTEHTQGTAFGFKICLTGLSYSFWTKHIFISQN